MRGKLQSASRESRASNIPLGGNGTSVPKSQAEGRPGRGSWSAHSETVSLGFVVVLAALGCTCGFERWPKREARALLNLLPDVTEGAFVRRLLRQVCRQDFPLTLALFTAVSLIHLSSRRIFI